MNDISSNSSHYTHSEKKRKKLSVTITIGLVAKVLIVLIVFVILFSVYRLGVTDGKDRADKSSATGLQTGANLASRHWSQIGTITEISRSKIKIKDSRNRIKEAAITTDTTVVNLKGQTLKLTDLTTGGRVIVSGTKDEKDSNKLTATRIRLQQ